MKKVLALTLLALAISLANANSIASAEIKVNRESTYEKSGASGAEASIQPYASKCKAKKLRKLVENRKVKISEKEMVCYLNSLGLGKWKLYGRNENYAVVYFNDIAWTYSGWGACQVYVARTKRIADILFDKQSTDLYEGRWLRVSGTTLYVRDNMKYRQCSDYFYRKIGGYSVDNPG